MPAATTSDPLVLDRLRDAINSGDAARVAGCFTADFRAELPHHPERSFIGAERVFANWTAIFNTAPDLTAKVLRTVVSGAEIWSEWEITGMDTAGAPVTFAGPVIFTTPTAESTGPASISTASARNPADRWGGESTVRNFDYPSAIAACPRRDRSCSPKWPAIVVVVVG